MKYIPHQGDIIIFDFDPSSGKEIMKRRPAYVISRHAFNKHTGLAIVAPVTSTIRNIKLEVVLPKVLMTQGSVLIHQLKSLDFQHRNCKHIEKCPITIIQEISALVQVIVR